MLVKPFCDTTFSFITPRDFMEGGVFNESVLGAARASVNRSGRFTVPFFT